MAKFNTEAIVLKNIKFKDTDKIFTLLSRDRGKISAVAKGVRKVSSRRSGNLDTLNQIEVQLAEHVSGQNYLSEVKTKNGFKKVKSDYDLSKKAFYIVELVNKSIWEDESSHEVYDLLLSTLQSLDQGSEEPTVVINKFEIKFMQSLGYEPPKALLLSWREKMREGDFFSANLFIKNYVTEILQEDIKSLELE